MICYIHDTISSKDEYKMAPCRHSLRRRQWYVKPVEIVGTCSDENEYSRNEGKILCGHLYNAAVERLLSGVAVGDGEQCCIAFEDIADARLDFSANLCVNQGNPGLTGVQLNCGHRFSATHLLWHWCMSNMVCPVCRAEYKLSGRDVTRSSVENFPIASWRLLRGLLRTHYREIEEEEMRQVQIFNRQNIIEDVMDAVFGARNMFILVVSLEVGAELVTEYLPLHRTNNNFQALEGDLFHFSVQRASLRRFTAALNRVTRGSTSQSGVIQHPGLLRSTILMRVPGDYDDTSLLLVPIIQIAEIDLPVYDVLDCTEILSHVSMSRSTDVDTPPTTNTVIEPPLPLATIDVASESTPDASEVVSTDNVSGNPLAAVSTPIFSGRSVHISPTPIYRYMSISAPCIAVNGVLDLEMCQHPLTGVFDSLLGARLAVKASHLLQQVARCISGS